MNRARLVAFTSVATVLVAALALFFYLDRASHRKPQSIVAKVEMTTGLATARPPAMADFKTLAVNENIESQEVIATNRASEAILQLNGGTRIKINENSKVTVESGPQLRITLLEGDLTVLEWTGSTSGRPSIQIFQNGHELDTAGIANNTPKLIGREAPKISRIVMSAPVTATNQAAPPPAAAAAPGTAISVPTPEPTLPPPPVASPGVKAQANGPPDTHGSALSDVEIKTKMRSQLGFFQRCYLNYLGQLGSNATTGVKKGNVVVGFDIESTGHVSRTHLVRSDFSNPALERCVSEVVDRTIFHGFNGDKISIAEFPIALE